jgi:prophage antirepressor-like protein
MNIRIEKWLGHEIRFVEKSSGNWWAVAADVTKALGFSQAKDGTRKLPSKYKGVHKVPTLGGDQEMILLNEKGLYRLIMRSNKKEAEVFQDWVFEIIKQLRQSTGLEAFQVFRMLDKEHQRSAMANLCKTIKQPVQVDFIKANTIANKAVSLKHGYPKMVKKGNMPPEMLVDRQPILDETVELMGVRDRYGLNISVSDAIYERHTH